MRGLNITYPYKQLAVARAEIEDPLVLRLGVINSVVFENGRTCGYNTDHSGLITAYRASFGEADPGYTVIVGAGGAGSAVAFVLTALGAPELPEPKVSEYKQNNDYYSDQPNYIVHGVLLL